MARGFASGLIWGVVVVGVGLVAFSVLAPPPSVVEKAQVTGVADGLAGTTVAPATEATGLAPADPLADGKAPVAQADEATAPATAPTAEASGNAAPHVGDEAAAAQAEVSAEPAPAPTMSAMSAATATSATPATPAPLPPAPAASVATLPTPAASETAATAAPAATPIAAPTVPATFSEPVVGTSAPDLTTAVTTAQLQAVPAPASAGTDTGSAVAQPVSPDATSDAAKPKEATTQSTPTTNATGMTQTPTTTATTGTPTTATATGPSATATAAVGPVQVLAAGKTVLPSALAAKVEVEVSPEPLADGTSPNAPAASGTATAQALPPDTPAAAEAAPALSALDAALKAPSADAQPGVVAVPEPVGPKDALLQPSQEAGLTEPARLPQIAAADDPNTAPPQLVPQVVPTVTPPLVDASPVAPTAPLPRVITPQGPLPTVKELAPARPSMLKPAEIKPSIPGVQTNHLPQIGAAPKVDANDTAALPQIGTAAAANSAPADQPITMFARKFDGPVSKPMFVILLRDVGGAGMSRDDLAKLPFPVSFVVDPLATDAKEAASAYRAAGQEVLMLANGLPVGANASDVAQRFQTLSDILPEAVGVIDEATAGFQDNRALATIVLPVIADQGRGLVTYDKGLNAADQIARRDGLPAAVIFRRLDGAGESSSTIRRYLDRAAFKAAQEGSVVVIGDTRKDTVAAILKWTLEGKGAGVALAPVTAVMAAK